MCETFMFQISMEPPLRHELLQVGLNSTVLESCTSKLPVWNLDTCINLKRVWNIEQVNGTKANLLITLCEHQIRKLRGQIFCKHLRRFIPRLLPPGCNANYIKTSHYPSSLQ